VRRLALQATDAILDALSADSGVAVGPALAGLLRDTVAVGVAGHSHPQAMAVLAAARRWGDGREAQVLGSDLRLPAPSAAFANGFLIHCLEWDAVHEGAVVHAMSAVTAAAIAVAEREGAPREELFRAIAAGVALACLLGVAATSPLRFFRPATAGAVGAALACGRLLGLRQEALRNAIALGVAQAAGTMQAHVEGSVALPVQVGFAGRAGVIAADLAAAGISGPADPLEGAFGYFPLFDEGALGPCLGRLGTLLSEVSVKPWPSGRASHGILHAIARHPGREIAQIEAHVPPLVARLVGRPWRDLTPSSARLCMPFLAALMLRDGRIDPRAFVPDCFADEALIALGGRLRMIADGNPDPNALTPQHIVLTFADGSVEDIALDAVLGSPEAPLSDMEMARKLAFAFELGGLAAPADPLDLIMGERT
jgi:2-methylcitrate dehydratase PrpD